MWVYTRGKLRRALRKAGRVNGCRCNTWVRVASSSFNSTRKLPRPQRFHIILFRSRKSVQSRRADKRACVQALYLYATVTTYYVRGEAMNSHLGRLNVLIFVGDGYVVQRLPELDVLVLVVELFLVVVDGAEPLPGQRADDERVLLEVLLQRVLLGDDPRVVIVV